MGEKPDGGKRDEPTLELPSLRLPRLRRQKPAQEPEPQKRPELEAPPEPELDPRPKPGPKREKPPRDLTVDPWLAVAGTGLVVGLAGAAATYAALKGCEAVRGTQTCGGPGFLLLVAIVAAMVVLGAVLLKVCRVADAAGTSFLGVGILGVLVMVGLLDVVLSPWMFVLLPLLCAASYAASHWVATRLVAPAEPEG